MPRGLSQRTTGESHAYLDGYQAGALWAIRRSCTQGIPTEQAVTEMVDLCRDAISPPMTEDEMRQALLYSQVGQKETT